MTDVPPDNNPNDSPQRRVASNLYHAEKRDRVLLQSVAMVALAALLAAGLTFAFS